MFNNNTVNIYLDAYYQAIYCHHDSLSQKQIIEVDMKCHNGRSNYNVLSY